MEDELYHHGIKGQKWGVRRFQNEDGTLTAAGRERLKYRNRTINAGKTKADVDSIISTMSRQEKEKLAIDDDHYLNFEEGSNVVKRVLLKDGDIPVAFFDLLEDEDEIQVALGTRSDDKYRGKGYASKAAKEGLDWYEKNKHKFQDKKVVWGVMTDNEASIRIAKKNGFVKDSNSYSDDRKWVNYEKASSTLKNKTPYKVDEIKDYKGKLYFISQEKLQNETLSPRVPKNYFTDNNYEDNWTKRVCASSSVDGCLKGLSQNNSNKNFYVYEAKLKPGQSVYKPNKGAVPDADVTDEHWLLEPTKFSRVGKIKCTGDDGKDGIPFEYGDRKAELYGWNYKWTK